MQQLTAEDKARVFAQYLGCKYTDTTAEEPEVFPVIGETITCFERYPRAMATAQLILRNISKISDEDLRDACEIAADEEDKGIVPKGYSFSAEERASLITAFEEDMKVYQFDYRLADFLRSRSYALPYRGIDLFEAGIAIEQP